MSFFLGVDTGGTYTDAAILEDETRLVASAKSLTTREDLALGVGRAMAAALDDAGLKGADIAMVSLSTTLATNALVEGQGERVALILIGFSEKDMARQGLDTALKDDPVLRIDGGHTASGGEAAALDLDALEAFLTERGARVSAFAIAGQFATRNPAHESAVRDLIRARVGKPVTCSHELSAKLGGPKRAVTALLNARLVGMIDRLIHAVEGLMAARGVDAPLMVVRGDGALIHAGEAREKPIETILSGPAASLVGAKWLSGMETALVSDIGGTTTDVALLQDGRPQIDPDGAMVGGHRTMVEAVAMRTFGLGGDSEVSISREGLSGQLVLGPRRVLPISLLAMDAGDVVAESFERWLGTERSGEYDGRFVRAVPGAAQAGLGDRALRVLDKIGDSVVEQGAILANRMEAQALTQLVTRGVVQVAGLTPSDAAHLLDLQGQWDRDAAVTALTLFAKKRTNAGERLADSPEQLARMVIDQLEAQTVEALLETAFGADPAFDGGSAGLARHALMDKGLAHHRGVVALDAGLNVPLIGLGASARSYYGPVGLRLSSQTALPEAGGVANAIGAVVGQVRFIQRVEVTSGGEGLFLVPIDGALQRFAAEEPAVTAAEEACRTAVVAKAEAAGVADIQIAMTREVNRAEVEGTERFIDAQIEVVASGRPGVAV